MHISSKFPITYPVDTSPSVMLSIPPENELEPDPSPSVVSPFPSIISESVGSIDDAQDTAAAILGDDGERTINFELPPLNVSCVSPSTVSYLLQLNMRHITELRLDRVIINQSMLENMYYLSGRLNTLSLGLVKILLDSAHQHHSSSQNHHLLEALPYRHRGRLIAIDEKLYRFLNGSDLKYILVSCGSEIHELDLDINVGDVRNDIFSYCPKLTSLKVCGIALLKGNHSSHCHEQDIASLNDRESGVCSFVIYSQGAVSVEHLTENLQGISLSNLLALLTAVTEENSGPSAYRIPTASEFASRTGTARTRTDTARSRISSAGESEFSNADATLTQVAYALVDSRGLIILVNAAWERLTGYESDLAISATLSLLLGDLSDLRELKAVVDAYKNPVPNHPAEASVFLYRKVPLNVCSISSVVTWFLYSFRVERYFSARFAVFLQWLAAGTAALSNRSTSWTSTSCASWKKKTRGRPASQLDWRDRIPTGATSSMTIMSITYCGSEF